MACSFSILSASSCLLLPWVLIISVMSEWAGAPGALTLGLPLAPNGPSIRVEPRTGTRIMAALTLGLPLAPNGLLIRVASYRD